MEAQCRIQLMGGLAIERDEQRITRFRTRKTAELLAYLAYYRQRTHSREFLIELLWPECQLDAGRHNLSMALSSLRPLLEPAEKATEGTLLLLDRHTVGLAPSAINTDVAEFEATLRATTKTKEETQQTQLLATAVELYGGELLPGYYSDWIVPEQQRLEELFLQAMGVLVARHAKAANLDHALQYALRALNVNRLREEAHRAVIRLYLTMGQADAALRHYRALEEMLRAELNAAPDARSRALLRAIQSQYMNDPVSNPPPPVEEPEVRDPSVLLSPPAPVSNTLPLIRSEQLEPIGGAVPLNSSFYVQRPTDAEFHDAIARQDSIVLVKGARQVGKTSLLARGLQQARESGAQVVLTNFQVFNAAHLASAEALCLAMAEAVAEHLDMDVSPSDVWDERRGPNPNLRRFMRREVLGKITTPLVWGLDEVDRLFSCPFRGEIFALFRSWHDERALEPGGPWEKLTLAMAYSTEAQLFITDINQSPFNVGTRLSLTDFTPAQVADLNLRYGSPLDEKDCNQLFGLVGGLPYLVRLCLHEVVRHGTDLETLTARAVSDDWIFGEHLGRMAALLTRDAPLAAAVREVLKGHPCPSREDFLRLRIAGILVGDTPREARLRCRLYSTYLEQALPG